MNENNFIMLLRFARRIQFSVSHVKAGSITYDKRQRTAIMRLGDNEEWARI